jgi:hypothetical protein
MKLKLKAVVKKPNEEEESPPQPVEEAVAERPKARLVEREHASSSLLKSVMKNGSNDQKDTREEPRETKNTFPKISF